MPKKVTQSKKLNVNQSQELSVLRKVVDITNSELDLSFILSEVVKIVTEMTKADSVFIYLFDEKKRHLVLMASKTPHKKELGSIILKSGEGITGWVARENRPVAISENAYADKRFKNFDVLPEDRYEAFLSVPIVHKNKAIGVINVQHKKSHEHAESTISLMSTIAKQISGVIEHARLYEETKKKALQFDSLQKVSESITSKAYLDEILNLIVVVTAEMLNSKICSIMLLDKKGKELEICATQSLSTEYKKKPNLKVDESLSGEVIKIKKPIAIYDVREDKKYRFKDLAIKENLTSMVAIPMVLKDKAIGVINVYTKEHHIFSEEEINVLQIVANQAAVAVENTKLMEEAIKSKEALEARKVIERAKGILMEMNNLNEAAAHRLIHKKAMDSCKSMKEIAESIILMDEFQKGK
ncbi:MAG: GAF domain-containing protein [Candidatus Omnitrophica bacterium]|nr:GAF domain-containing protein [Candidatus Omnitrophota bacterium]MCB9747136.1 GAF domain-containing protein [Candidatus Omnitrophota bacterium]